jgi:hypothetical protein
MWETKVVGKVLNRPQITQVWNFFNVGWNVVTVNKE